MPAADSFNHVDLIFPAMGSAMRREHGYGLYGAISRIVPWLHTEEAKRQHAGIFPIHRHLSLMSRRGARCVDRATATVVNQAP